MVTRRSKLPQEVPFTLTQPRWRMAGAALVAVGFAVLGLVLVFHGMWAGWLVAALCGVGAALVAIDVVHPPTLEVTEEGLVATSTAGAIVMSVAWRDVDSFVVVPMPRKHGPVVGLCLTQEAIDGAPRGRSRIAVRITQRMERGEPGVLGFMPGSAARVEELVALLNRLLAERRVVE